MAQVGSGEPPPDFATALRHRRLGTGMTQEELARRTGISTRAIGDLERGRVARPQTRTLRALAAALTTDEAELRALLPRGGAEPAASEPGWGGLLCAPPPEIADFTGRERELAELRARLADRRDSHRAPVFVITGAPGSGKSAFLVRAAHRLADAYPGGCFHLPLGRGPVDVAHVLGVLLGALGVPSRRLPEGTDARSSLYRSLLRDRKVLLLVDDVTGEEQVRPLLPSNPDCLVLVAGRRGLAGLESVGRVPLDVLAPADSVRLLAAIAGAERIRREPSASLALAGLCGHLPLALRIAGNRLAERPRWRVADLLRVLDDPSGRLTELTAGDLRVRPAFEASYRLCGDVARSVFRRLSAVEDGEIAVRRVAVLGEVDVDSAGRALEELVDLGLLECAAGGGSYELPALLRLFAAERCAAEEPLPALRARATALAGRAPARHHALRRRGAGC
ncbi:helix-turn-helix domain-containing protein [Saccharopolyspora sp. MS10]|uniref:helix-turn-helix domain-containing protein n=1 Tax=Saccharopolyspora sp. MS10 TaxID=3385973 RepID=UPI00399F9A37